MSIFHYSDRRERRLGPTALDERLPIGQSVPVIAGLSVLAWVAVIWVIRALVAAV
jgi:hypothetical protein